MPVISMFYGILIAMYYEDTGRHNKPHIHVRYQGKKGSISIEDGSVLAGDLPSKQLRLVIAWIAIHKDALLAAWEFATAGEGLCRINPLQ